MSNATTNKQALQEFAANLKRINKTPEAQAAATGEAIQWLAQRLQKKQERHASAVSSFVAANRAAFDAHLAAEEAADAE